MIDPKIAAAYLPSDRRRALARGETLPETSAGIVLFADISGFTPLTAACVEALGPTRGAEVATRHLNAVYDALVSEIHGRGGSIVGFSGDGMLCWFAQDDAGGAAGAARTAYAAAGALHAAIEPFARVAVTPQVVVPIGLKVAVAGGRVRRLVAGDPDIQLIDVLAGQPVDAVSEGERLALRGESVFEAAVVEALGSRPETWREAEAGHRFAPLAARADDCPTGIAADAVELDAESARPWLLPALAARLETGQQEYLAELRPTVALFLRFAGLDFVHDDGVAAKVNVFVVWAQRIVTRMGGALLQLTTGDKGSYLYASFGATEMHTDDAARAAAAGLGLLGYREAAPWLTEVRIGIAGGRTRVGPYGGAERCTFGAQGAAVNMAARLMTVAAPDTVVLAQSVADAVRATFQVETLGPHTLKGLETPVALYRLTGRRDPVAELDPEQLRVPRMGRAAEWAALCGLLDAARSGHGSWVSLTGPAGIGKSWLAAECVQRGATGGMRIVIVRGESTAREVAYAALGHLARSLLGLARAMPPAAMAQAVADWFAQHAPEWQPRVALLRDVLDVPLPEAPLTAGLSAQQRQEALANLVSDLMTYACGQGPVLLLVEDGQHVDEASWSALTALGRRAAALPMLMLVCARSGDELNLGAQPGDESTKLDLPPLEPPEIARLVEARLGKPVDGLLTQIVVHVTQGNPAYGLMLADALREEGFIADAAGRWAVTPAYFQTLREARALHYGEDQWRLAPAASGQAGLPGLPISMQGMLLGRIDRLGDAAKLTLKVASVVGRTFELAVVAGVNPAGYDEAQMARQLDALVEQGVLAAGGDATPVTYEFRQSVLQEALYQSLLETQQRTLNGAVGRALEGVAPHAVERLARHFASADLANLPTRGAAVHYLGLAATKSRRENANETARYFLRQLTVLAPGWASYRSLIEVSHLLGAREEEAAALASARSLDDVDPGYHDFLTSRYYEAVARYDDAWSAAESALRYARSGGEIATVQVQMASIAGREGDYRREEQGYQAALTALTTEPTPDTQTLIEVYYGRGTVRKQQGDYRGALEVWATALELAAQAGRAAEQARVLMAMGVVSRLQRSFTQARRYTEHALALRRDIGDRAGEGDALFSLAQVVIHGVGDHAQGRSLLNEALGIQRALGNRWSQAIVLNELGVVHYLAGLPDDAERILRDVLGLCQAIGAAAGLVYVRWNLGLVLREQGSLIEAHAALSQAYHEAQALDDPHVTAQLRGELGLTELALGEAAAALAHATAAIAALEELGLRVMTPADRATAAQATLRLHDRDRALAQAREAIAILDACRGEGPDFPHREYRRCGEVLAACSQDDEAAAAFDQARRLLDVRAAAISDPELRATFLAHSPGCTAIGVKPPAA